MALGIFDSMLGLCEEQILNFNIYTDRNFINILFFRWKDSFFLLPETNR